MSRAPVVTRTITTTTVKLLAVDMTSKTTDEVQVTLPRTYKNDDALLKMANKRRDKEHVKFVAVLDAPVVQKKRWGMTEEEFIDAGREFPPYKSEDDADNGDYVETDSAAPTVQ